MANPADQKVHRYSAWAVPPEIVSGRIKKLMAGLRAEFGGPEIIEPHIPMVGSILSTHNDVVKRFREACGATEPLECTIERVATRKFYYQCVILCIEPQEVDRPMKSFSRHFGRLGNMPHLSLLYGDLTQEEKDRAKAKAEVLDDSIVGLRFTINRAVLYKCNEDMTQQSWEKIDECRLS